MCWFGASDATLPYAVDYAHIYILGSVFVLMVMGMNTFITTQGFAQISMLTTIIGAVINIILDPILSAKKLDRMKIMGISRMTFRSSAMTRLILACPSAINACWELI